MKPKINKIISVVLAFVMCLSLCPMSAFAAGEPISIGGIDFTVSNFPVPAVGASMTRNINDIGGYDSEKCSINASFTGWVDLDDSLSLDFRTANTFASGTVYGIRVNLTPKEGYEFDKNANYTFDGIPASDKYVNASGDITLRFYYSATEGTKTPITALELGDIPAPVLGGSTGINSAKITGLENCYYSSNSWKVKSTGKTFTDPKFKGGTAYQLILKLTAKIGCEFVNDESSVWSLAGASFAGAKITNNNTKIELTFDFPAAETAITELNLGGVTAPAAGQPAALDLSDITGINETCYLLTDDPNNGWYVNGEKWADLNTSKNFESASVYELHLRFKANSGYYFSSVTNSLTAAMDGASFPGNAVLEGGAVSELRFKFPATEGADLISSLNLSGIAAPEAGESSARDAGLITGLNSCSLVNIHTEWRVDGYSTFTKWDTPKVFAPGRDYMLALRLRAEPGYLFDTTATALINWQLAGATTKLVYIYDYEALLFFAFPQTAGGLSITPFDIPARQVGEAVSLDASEHVSGGFPPYRYSISGGPTWLKINSETGEFTGAPVKAAAATTVKLTVTDSSSPALSKTETLPVGAVTTFLLSSYAFSVDAPVAGCNAKRSIAVPDGYWLQAGEWQTMEGFSFASTGAHYTRFAENTKYRLKLTLAANSGYDFYESAPDENWTLPGATFISKEASERSGTKYMSFLFEFDATGDAAENRTITDLTLSGVAPPVTDGLVARDIAAIGITGTGFYIYDGAWYLGNEFNKALTNNDATFMPATVYTLMLRLCAEDGYIFPASSSELSCTLDGISPVITFLNGGVVVELKFVYPATAGARTPIDSLTLDGIAAPVAKQTTVRNAENVTGLIGCTMNTEYKSLWKDSAGTTLAYWRDTDKSFAADTVYKLTLELTADSEHKFDRTAPASAFTLGGAAAESIKITGTNDEIATIVFAFPVTAADPLTISESVDINIPKSYVGWTLNPTIDASAAVSGGKRPLTYSLTGAPAGITIDSKTGVISGKPTAVTPAGSATLTVTDSSASPQTATRTLTMGGAAEPTVISDYALELNGFAPPVAGGSTARTITNITGCTGCTIYNPTAVEFWATNRDGTAIYDGADFQPGETYYLVLTLMPDYGYKFADGIANNAFTLNDGSVAGITSCHVSVTGITYRKVVFRFPQTGGAIPSAAVTVPIPVPGASATAEAYTTATTEDTDYTVSAVTWKQNSADFTGKFVPGKNYTAHVTLTPKNVAELPFSAESTLTVNGETNPKTVTGGVMTFSKSFTVGARTDIVNSVTCDVQNAISLTADAVIPANTLNITTPADGSVTGVSFAWEKKNTANNPATWEPFDTIAMGAAGTQTLTAGTYRAKITIQITGDDAYTKMFANWSTLEVTFGGTTAEVLAAGHTVSGGASGLDSIASFYTGEYTVDCATHNRDSWGHTNSKHWETCSVCGQKFGEEGHSFVSGICECGLTEAELPVATVGNLNFGTVKLGYGAQMGQYVPVTVSGSTLTIAELNIAPADADKFTVSTTGNAAKTLTVGANNDVWQIIPQTGLAAGTYNVTMTLTAAELATPVTGTATIVVDPLTFTYQPSAEDTTGSFTETITATGAHTPPTCPFTAPAGKGFESWIGGSFTPNGENQTFYPQWVNYTLIATFNENGGGITGSTNVRTNGSGTSIQLQDPSAYGISAPADKAFRGWAKDSPSGTVYDAGYYYPVTVTEAITFYAVWGDRTYTVNFNAGGGTGTMESVTGAGNYDAPACTFTAPAGKMFSHWRFSHDMGSVYLVGTTWIPTSDGQNVTATAQWADMDYTIQFNGNGGGGSMTNATGAGSFTLPSCSFDKPEGKSAFSHWALGSTSGTRYNVGSTYYAQANDETVTFYAIWTDKQLQAPLSITGLNATLGMEQSVHPEISGGSGSGAASFVVTPGTGAVDNNGGNGWFTATQVGTVTFKAVKAGDGTYEAAESDPITVTITPTQITPPTADTTVYTYDAAVKTYNIGIDPGYQAKDNSNKQTLANEEGYTVVVELVDKANTVWADTLDNVDKTFNFKIMKALPTGQPQISTISTTGKTLEYTSLRMNNLQPNDGVLAWDDPIDTVVEANKSYGWTYTPADLNNYKVLKGTFVPYRTGGGGGGGGSRVTTPSKSITTTGTVTDTQLTNAAKAAKENEAVDITNKTADRVTATAGGILKLADNGNSLIVNTKSGNIEIDNDTLKAIAEGVKANASVNIEVTQVKSVTDNEELAELIKNGNPVFDVSVLVSGKQVHELGGAISFGFEYSDINKFKNPVIKHFKADGTTEILKPVIDGNKITVKGITELSYFAVIEGEEKPVTPTEPKLKFTDVKENDWYYDVVCEVYEKALMNGVSETEFAPNAMLTRAMFVTVLYRLEGEPQTTKGAFTDLGNGMYYENAANWANANGIVNGVSADKFAPNNNITREQMAAILYRYAKFKGIDVSVGEDTNILSYNDAEKISEYAIPAIQWACGAGIISGKPGGILDPIGNATRAETAAMLVRILGLIK